MTAVAIENSAARAESALPGAVHCDTGPAIPVDRRLRSRPWHTDWLVLRRLGSAIARELAETKVKSGGASGRIVDFGCGSMPYRPLVEDLGFIYAGADFGYATLPIDAAGRLPVLDRSAEAVLSIQVLEHVRDLDRYLGEALRVLKQDGSLILSTHGNWLYHPHPEDHRRWTRTGLILDLETRGFTVETVQALVGPLATTTMIRLTGVVSLLRRLPLAGAPFATALTLAMNARGWLEDVITPPSIRDDNACVYIVRAKKTSA